MQPLQPGMNLTKISAGGCAPYHEAKPSLLGLLGFGAAGPASELDSSTGDTSIDQENAMKIARVGLSVVSGLVGFVHGFSKKQSILAGLGWGAFGVIFPVLSVGVVIGQRTAK